MSSSRPETLPPPFDPAGTVRHLPERPGVYRMFDSEGAVIYVGKARNLRRRVGSYFTRGRKTAKTQRLVEQIHDIQVVVTHTEAEALILENTLIKEHRPRYNVLLRDDKSYPYIYLSTQQRFPRLTFHRGGRSAPGRYFGPFPSVPAVRETLNHLQKVIPVRQCRDAFFRNRSRPCLQYQIRRCTAPCVGYISEEAYAEDVRHVEMFLDGRSEEVIEELIQRMERASQALEYEKAARWRDRIAALRAVQERQHVAGERGDLDVVALAVEGDTACIQVFFIRRGQSLGNRAFHPRVPHGSRPAEILSAFLAGYYLEHPPPAEILVNQPVREAVLLGETLSGQAGRSVEIRHRVRGERRRWVEMAEENAHHSLAARTATHAALDRRFRELARVLDVDRPPERLECFDVSHTGGEATVASCVVFNREGPLKSDYRRFNIQGAKAGDDYAAIREAVSRRYRKVRSGGAVVPDLIIIDGGKGQLAEARAALDETGIGGAALLAISKGPARRPGEESLWLVDERQEMELPSDSPALHLLQHIRDEAHRFAITGHRQRRGKKHRESTLEAVPGLGPVRRKSLLQRFGGLQGIRRAGVEDLTRVPGISRSLAQRIYETFHG